MAEREYRTSLERRELEQAIDEIWQELQTSEQTRAEVRAMGIDVDAVASVSRQDALKVSRSAAGFGPETIVIAFLPVAVKVTSDLWEKFILPWLLRKYGRDAMKEEKPGS